jgi:NTE family protein
MSLHTIIHSGATRKDEHGARVNGLILMGGGARTAYQVGVLQAISNMLKASASASKAPNMAASFPFKVLVGTSAGALNAAFLASASRQGLGAFDALAEFWKQLRSDHVYSLKVSPWLRFSRILTALRLRRHAMERGAVLDNMPLVDTLHKAISLLGIEDALASKTIDALAVSAASYTSGVHWTFCQTAKPANFDSWRHPGRRAEFQPITIEHLIASSAIPFIFPATELWVDDRSEFFGDGTMRQISPLSPAFHLGANNVLVIGAGQAQRSGLVGSSTDPHSHHHRATPPTLGTIAGYAMGSVFHDTMQADVEQTQRVTQSLRKLPASVAQEMAYRPVEVLAIAPSQSLDVLAQLHANELPYATRSTLEGLGALHGHGSALASYLLFEPGFIHALMQLGEQDAQARQGEILAFFGADK